MKKLVIMTLALIASTTVINASTDVYSFKTTLKYPAIGKTAFIPASTPVIGTLTVNTDDPANITASLVLKLKKTGATYTFVPEDTSTLAIFGKNAKNCAHTIKFVNEDPSEGLIEFTFAGWGILKTKTTGGCTPCGDTTESCSRVTKMQGVVAGKYICPCGGSFIEWDGTCEIGDSTVDVITVYAPLAIFSLKSVNGSKW